MSLGQGQEAVAEQALEVAAAQGHWVILQVRGTPGHPAGHAALPAMAQSVPRLPSASPLTPRRHLGWLRLRAGGSCPILLWSQCSARVACPRQGQRWEQGGDQGQQHHGSGKVLCHLEQGRGERGGWSGGVWCPLLSAVVGGMWYQWARVVARWPFCCLHCPRQGKGTSMRPELQCAPNTTQPAPEQAAKPESRGQKHVKLPKEDSGAGRCGAPRVSAAALPGLAGCCPAPALCGPAVGIWGH